MEKLRTGRSVCNIVFRFDPYDISLLYIYIFILYMCTCILLSEGLRSMKRVIVAGTRDVSCGFDILIDLDD